MSQALNITVTAEAQAHFKAHITASKSAGVRLSMKPNGCAGYGYDVTFPNKKPDDALEYEFEGVLIWVDSACSHLFQGVSIDYVQRSLGQKQLVFDNPQVASMCGCGESVQLKDEET
tara:strand:- start:3440 stop:3790 length:351 start_codon:yes stop_codon:yes gene_type:complete